MKVVASRANPFFKDLRKLARSAAGAREQGLVWLEGVHLCQEYLQRVGAPRHAVFDARRIGEQGAPHGAAELQALLRALPAHTCVALAAGLLEAVSEVAAAQGVGFVVELPRPALPARVTGSCVVLDQVQDPGNVGSIIRTCAAAGVQTVLLTAGSAAAWSPKVLRAGQGAHFAVVIHEELAAETVAERLAVPAIVTELGAAASLYQAALPHPAAWVFGHEGRGVGPVLMRRASCRVSIPQTAGVESLNVAAAAAVCLFEQRRRLLA